MRMNLPLARFAAILFVATAISFGGVSRADDDKRQSPRIRAMTQNLYVGADLFRILSVTAPEQVPAVVAEIFGIIQQTNFQGRADAIAKSIEHKRPDVIGLQEVSLIRIQTPSDYFVGNPNQAETVAYDYLQILLAALKARGLHYHVASQVQNVDIELPAFAGIDEYGIPIFNDVRLTDRDVILVKDGVRTSGPTSANFQVNLEIPVAGNTIAFTRGYTGVDVKLRHKKYRVINTHLEVKGEGQVVAVQALQAQELIGVLASEHKPVVLLGDLNSAPNETIDLATGAVPPYMQFSFSGYRDSWLQSKNADQPGFTCCQAELLMNPGSLFDQRIDYVLYRNQHYADARRKTGVYTDVVGDEETDKTSAGLWPSDHGGVFASIRVPHSAHHRR
jgi:endonuclease/exonuclease/phosphatase family metal-dependent hydrolase